MEIPYFHVDATTIRAPARDCYELVTAIRRYGEWWKRVRCEPLGTEGTLRVGSRFRFSGGPVSWVIEVTGLHPWRRIDLRYAEDMLGPVTWEFLENGVETLVRYAYHGVTPNSDYTRQSFASGRSLRLHTEAMQTDAFAGMRRLLERPHQLDGSDLFTAIHTLRAVRRFRPDPVPDTALHHVIEAATRAASARNTQPWYFVVARSEAKKAEIARLYLEAWRQAQAYTAQTGADADIMARPDYEGMMRSVNELAEQLKDVPVLILACVDTRQLGPLADSSGRILSPQSAYASIFPAVQNLMLAARGLGLGTTLTTVFASVEGQLRLVLGIPEHVHIAALIPLGYPRTPFRATNRKALGEVAFLDQWGVKLVRE
jgi:nitroreductase/uncharacterized protein YndB with AHSA1/START domain